MATPFSDVFDIFLSKVPNHQLTNMDATQLEDYLTNFLLMATTYFKSCKNDLTQYDNVLKSFNVDLTFEEKDILATWMKYEFEGTCINDANFWKVTLSSKDYERFSPANQMRELKDAQERTLLEANRKLVRYSFSISNLKDLQNGKY